MGIEGKEYAVIRDTFKFYLMPLERMLFTLRIENLDDLFDHPIPLDDPLIDIDQLISDLLALANKDNKTFSLKDYDWEVMELGLGGNQDVDEIKNTKVEWVGVDDDKLGRVKKYQGD